MDIDKEFQPLTGGIVPEKKQGHSGKRLIKGGQIRFQGKVRLMKDSADDASPVVETIVNNGIVEGLIIRCKCGEVIQVDFEY